ncbi:hypothetical protein [Caballeronia temeraria]|uniref:hypothetical protein n=1 Tax=Caballeronia temeraria TaxID=1777137 RepID=UPI001FC9BEC8|nr:hypothetical protein [Caballeronia temeraria]
MMYRMFGRLAEATGVVVGELSLEEPHDASVKRLATASATAARRVAIERCKVIVVMAVR